MAPHLPGDRPGPARPRRRNTAARVGVAAFGLVVLLWLLSGPALNLLGELLMIAAGLAIIRFAWRRMRRVSWREVGGALLIGALISDLLDNWRRR